MVQNVTPPPLPRSLDMSHVPKTLAEKEAHVYIHIYFRSISDRRGFERGGARRDGVSLEDASHAVEAYPYYLPRLTRGVLYLDAKRGAVAP